MTVYVVTNGFQGDGACCVFIEAASESGAIEAAAPVFRANASDNGRRDAPLYHERYWTDLQAQPLPLGVVSEWGG